MGNRKVRILVDVFMTVFVILSYIRWSGFSGLVFHGIVGIAFALFAVVHVWINRKWLVSVSGSIKSGKASEKLKRLYSVDLMLIVGWGTAIITGFIAIPYFISGLPGQVVPADSALYFSYVAGRIHAISSRIGGGMIIVHIVQHWSQIRSYFGIKKRNRSI